MGKHYKDYTDLATRLREYSDNRKGEISKITYDAAKAIEALVEKVLDLERQIDGSKDDLK